MDFTNAHHNHNDGFWAYVATWQVPEVPREPEPAVHETAAKVTLCLTKNLRWG